MTVSQTSFVADGQQVRCLVDCPSVRICLMFYPAVDWDDGFRKEDPRGKGLFHHIVSSNILSPEQSLLMLTLTTWLWCRSSDFSIVLYSPCPTVPSVLSWMSLCTAHTQGAGDGAPLVVEQLHTMWNSSPWAIPPPLHPYMCVQISVSVSISVSQYGVKDIDYIL